MAHESGDRRNCRDQCERRTLCVRLGKGVFKLIPQDDLSNIFSHPIMAALYLPVLGSGHGVCNWILEGLHIVEGSMEALNQQ